MIDNVCECHVWFCVLCGAHNYHFNLTWASRNVLFFNSFAALELPHGMDHAVQPMHMLESNPVCKSIEIHWISTRSKKTTAHYRNAIACCWSFEENQQHNIFKQTYCVVLALLASSSCRVEPGVCPPWSLWEQHFVRSNQHCQLALCAKFGGTVRPTSKCKIV